MTRDTLIVLIATLGPTLIVLIATEPYKKPWFWSNEFGAHPKKNI